MSEEKNIAVLVSGGGSNLQALIDAEAAGRLGGGRLSLVISSHPNAYALTRAAQAGVPARVVAREAYETRAAFTQAVLEELRVRDIHLIVLAGFLYVLSPAFCLAYPGRVINVHPALIPAFCGDGCYGLRVHRAVLAYGVKVTGATVHFVSEETDGGPIILQKAVAVESDDTPESLQRRVMEQAEWILLPEAVRLFCEGRLHVDGRRVMEAVDS
ncbi:MAG: phosphoribosylglycinamide formyltransferase [Oscillospiraceae bacterium]|nr:phosphoribosylglycinamide formyltransferase [Oscillospiraceae bacterium]